MLNTINSLLRCEHEVERRSFQRSADQWPHSCSQSNSPMELTNHFVYSAPLIALMWVFSWKIDDERGISKVPVRTGEVQGNRKLPTPPLRRARSGLAAFSASQPDNKPRRRAPLPYRRQQHKSVLLRWFRGNRSVHRERLWLRDPAAPAHHSASWNRGSGPPS